MSSRWRAESVLEDLKDGKIDDYDAKRELERIYGSCSCIRSEIGRVVNRADSWSDPWSDARRLDNEAEACHRRERAGREEEEQEF